MTDAAYRDDSFFGKLLLHYSRYNFRVLYCSVKVCSDCADAKLLCYLHYAAKSLFCRKIPFKVGLSWCIGTIITRNSPRTGITSWTGFLVMKSSQYWKILRKRLCVSKMKMYFLRVEMAGPGLLRTWKNLENLEKSENFFAWKIHGKIINLTFYS